MSPVRTVLLVVDDDRDVRETLAEVLEGPGVSVEAYENGRDVLTRLERGPVPDLMLLDLMMPYVDGFGVLSQMRQMPSLAKVPVIVVSASLEAEQSLAAGATSVLSKPFELDQLMGEVARALKLPPP